MKIHGWTVGVALLGALLFASPACAAGEKSFVGKEAPEIDVADWINPPKAPTLKGNRGSVVIVEFWATWCPPCRKSIPHLIEIYEKYRSQGLVVFGLTQEDRKTVEPFAKQNKMSYHVGLDRSTGGTYGVTGIPHAVVVGVDGKVIWEGHPMSMDEKLLQEALKKVDPAYGVLGGKTFAAAGLKGAVESVRKHKMKEALDAAKKVSDAKAKDAAGAAEADEFARLVTAFGDAALAEIDSAVGEGRYADGQFIANDIADWYKGLDAGAKAAKKAGEFKMGVLKKGLDAEKLWAQAQDLEGQDKTQEAWKAYTKIAKEYKETYYGPKAAAKADEIKRQNS